MESKNYDYDVIIIGAGIGGLVCGCYLAKTGFKTLIVEKNARSGGYCTSFSRKNFKFDACAHSLGSLREDGNIRRVLDELKIQDFKFTRFDPQDVVVTPDYKIHFWNDLEKTIKEFQENFPNESSGISRFFHFVNSCKGAEFNSLRDITFTDLLDKYINDTKLRAILSILILGNTGMPPSAVSAFTAVTIYKEFVLDGGYYPEGNMQALPDLLLKTFKSLKGKVFLSTLVKKIIVAEGRVEGIEAEGKGFVSAKYVVSDIDATQTFSKLINEECILPETLSCLKQLEPSLSMFILYLGVEKSIESLFPDSNLWVLPNYDVEKMYQLAKSGEVESLDWFLARLLPDKKSVIVLVNAPFKNKEYWQHNKDRLVDVFINKIERVIPNFSKHIIFKEAATPSTLYEWTLNYNGSSFGWEGTRSQFCVRGFSQVTPVKNLYLTGHWATLAQGIPGVAYLGRSTANLIIKRKKSC